MSAARSLRLRSSHSVSKLTKEPTEILDITPSLNTLLWKKTSSPPVLGTMKPKPFSAFQTFTVPSDLLSPDAKCLARPRHAAAGLRQAAATDTDEDVDVADASESVWRGSGAKRRAVLRTRPEQRRA
eukprot:CAMPEP_0206594452 /NCGR_PEP_ID=MMETSP0325_2-20121206/42376_1 /ASSEMBLY_ACC=CAM_ASM_000347 /TAXON_ID=2866 /ORGANISM="Crypthecodinium cohnii, Strain Seligo" /LENGTH=126 /DNA_ID=CAMNT_0054104903 /DNA_START=459 /DNA_END=836 /DNA_ORIENTATION=+